MGMEPMSFGFALRLPQQVSVILFLIFTLPRFYLILKFISLLVADDRLVASVPPTTFQLSKSPTNGKLMFCFFNFVCFRRRGTAPVDGWPRFKAAQTWHTCARSQFSPENKNKQFVSGMDGGGHRSTHLDNYRSCGRFCCASSTQGHQAVGHDWPQTGKQTRRRWACSAVPFSKFCLPLPRLLLEEKCSGNIWLCGREGETKTEKQRDKERNTETKAETEGESGGSESERQRKRACVGGGGGGFGTKPSIRSEFVWAHAQCMSEVCTATIYKLSNNYRLSVWKKKRNCLLPVHLVVNVFVIHLLDCVWQVCISTIDVLLLSRGTRSRLSDPSAWTVSRNDVLQCVTRHMVTEDSVKKQNTFLTTVKPAFSDHRFKVAPAQCAAQRTVMQKWWRSPNTSVRGSRPFHAETKSEPA